MRFLPAYRGTKNELLLNRNKFNVRNAPEVVNYDRELKKLNDQLAATSDTEEKSKLMTRLSEVEQQHRIADSADVSARGPPEACILAPSREPPLGSDCCFFLFFGLLVACRGLKS